MTDIITLAIGVSLVITVAASLILSRQMVSPIQRIMAAGQQIAGGRYDKKLVIAELSESNQLDELDRLSLSINRMAEKLEETESLRHQLIGDVSNQLHQPLSTIKDYMEGLLDGVIPPSPESFHHIYVEAERLQSLVKDIQNRYQDVNSTYRLEREPVATYELVEAVVRQMYPRFEKKGIGLEIHQAPGLRKVYVDKNRILQALTILVGNALKYTPAKGKVIIEASGNGRDITISVIDTGVGISPDHLEHLFNHAVRPGYTSVGEVTRHGLTIVQALIIAHGGKIWAESAGEGKGSVFHFTLPAYNLPVTQTSDKSG